MFYYYKDHFGDSIYLTHGSFVAEPNYVERVFVENYIDKIDSYFFTWSTVKNVQIFRKFVFSGSHENS